MADWYVSSTAYAAVAAFVPSAVYSVGNIVKPTAPVAKARWVFRCTTAGTASTEPAWPTGDSATIVTGCATFTNVTGQSTYFWAAAAGDLPTLLGAVGAVRFVAGDRMFVSSDHAETQASNTTYGSSGSGAVSYSSSQVLSVNRAGSTPPVPADLTGGATCTVSGGNNLFLDNRFPVYHYGITFVAANNLFFGSTGAKQLYFDSCQLYLSANASNTMNSNGVVALILNNTTLRFSNSGQGIRCSSGPVEITWLNTPSAYVGTVVTQLFGTASNSLDMLITVRGVDLSAMTSGALFANAASNAPGKLLFDSCRIASGVTRYNNGSVIISNDLVELVNCYDGSSFISESHQPSGDVTTEFVITLTGGATDNVGTFSHKMVSNANIDKYVAPLAGFWMDVNNTAIGSSHTATVEIVSSASLNNDEISLIVEYLGTASSSLASMATSLPVTVLTAASAVTASAATWNSLPATPVKQHLQVTFTPQTAGRVRAQVRLGKAATTVYVNPQMTIT